MKLIVGLGNIGKEFIKTRHNIGFMILDKYTGNVKWKKGIYGYYYKKQDTIFLKPSTYMNLSGKAVIYFIKYYKIDIEDLLIIQDDMDLEIGNYKLKKQSSSGGHKGIGSIIDSLGTNVFLRLKLGISRPENNISANHVLETFTSSEIDLLENKAEEINSIINDFISGNSAEELMNKYN